MTDHYPYGSEFEFKVAQNECLGATLLWKFCREYQKAKNDAVTGPRYAMIFLVLPLCLHYCSMMSIKGCRVSSGITMAISKDRSLPAGLQRRMIMMSGLTDRSLRLAVASGLLSILKYPQLSIYSTELTRPSEWPKNTDMEKAAKNLGVWFASTEPDALTTLLGVTF